MAGSAPITQDEMIAALLTQTISLNADSEIRAVALLAALTIQTDAVALAALEAAHLLMVETAAVNAHHIIAPQPLSVPILAKNRNEDYFESRIES